MMHRPSRWRRFLNRYGAYVHLAALVLCAGALIFSTWKLIAYGMDWLHAKQASNELQQAYYSALQEEATAVPAQATAVWTQAPTMPPQATEIPQVAATTAQTAGTATPQPWVSDYPNNPYKTVNAAIKKLQRQNEDIIGWLKIDGVLDEAVVQRDNSYYLRRDYRGYHNDNGSLFLDEACSLSRRPKMYMVYGHNMKTGAMFGCLRNWENISFYRSNPFIRFTAPYEEGTYVIFAVSQLGTPALSKGLMAYRYTDAKAVDEAMNELIMSLKSHSLFTSSVDVTVNDQLLLLVTCVGDEDERRVLAARRVREGETEEGLRRTLRQVEKR